MDKFITRKQWIDHDCTLASEDSCTTCEQWVSQGKTERCNFCETPVTTSTSYAVGALIACGKCSDDATVESDTKNPAERNVEPHSLSGRAAYHQLYGCTSDCRREGCPDEADIWETVDLQIDAWKEGGRF